MFLNKFSNFVRTCLDIDRMHEGGALESMSRQAVSYNKNPNHYTQAYIKFKTEELTPLSVANHRAELISGQYHLKESHNYIMLNTLYGQT